MKKFFVLSFLSLLAVPAAFAGTPSTYTERALGFRLIVLPSDDNISIVDGAGGRIEFAPAPGHSGNANIYREVQGRCVITLEDFSKNFASGKTKNDFMLTLSAQIVQVIKGEDACMLRQMLPNQMRSLTGVYEM